MIHLYAGMYGEITRIARWDKGRGDKGYCRKLGNVGNEKHSGGFIFTTFVQLSREESERAAGLLFLFVFSFFSSSSIVGSIGALADQ